MENKELKKVSFDLNNTILETMINYIFSQNANITKKSLIKMMEFFNILDSSKYDDDREFEVRIFLIKRLLEGKLVKKLLDINLLAGFVLGGQYDMEIQDIFDTLNDTPELSDDEVFFIDEYISERLTYGYLWNYEEKLEELLFKLKSGDFDSLSELNDNFEGMISSLYNNIKQAKAAVKHAARDFGTDSQSLDCAVTNTITNLNREANIIKTGIQWLNKMLDGGWQGGRCYLALGAPKTWKSGLLLNVALWAKKCNVGIIAKDPTKKPCVLLVSQENSMDETMERVWSHYFKDDSNIKDYKPDIARQMLEDAGFNDDDIAIRIKYRPNKSINTGDLIGMIEDLALENLEVVILVHDYVKRIRSVDYYKELRLELGAIVDEFTVNLRLFISSIKFKKFY